MTIANPIFLWALAGLTIPVAIHLLSRKEGKVLKLGSLRHVQETSTQQFRGIRLNEVALLILRCALILVFSLVLAGIFLPASKNSKWLLVEKGLQEQPRIATMIDSLTAEGYEPHWLIRGFPLLRDSVETGQRIKYRELVAQLSEKNISSTIVFSKNNIESFAGIRGHLGSNVRWISQPAGASTYDLQTFRITKDSIVTRRARNDANATTFEYTSMNENDREAIPEPVVSVGLIVDKKYEYDKRIIKAALNALAGMMPVNILIEESPVKAMNADWRIWLSDKEAAPGKIIRLRATDETNLIIQTGSSDWQLTKRLNEDLAIQSNLPMLLAGIIVPTRKVLEEVATSHDRRMLPDSIAWSYEEITDRPSEQKGSVVDPGEPFLLILFLILLTAERMLAYQRKQ